jgi:dihydrofolate reductase
MKITLIAAVGKNRIIGRGGQLPWKMPQEQARFHAITMGKPILMGRKTFDEDGRPLPGRPNLILTRNPIPIPGTEIFTQLETALARAARLGPELMVIGGAEIYALTLPIATGLCLTTIELAPEGDTFFPEVDYFSWRLVNEQTFPANQSDPYPCIMRDWERSPQVP